jgi:hypothetical protein
MLINLPVPLKTLIFFILMLFSAFAYPKEISFYFYGQESSNEWQGALQGLKEANIQGKFLNLKYQLTVKTNLNEIKAHQPVAVISSLPLNELAKAIQANPKIPFFNLQVVSNQDVIACAPNLFHIRPHLSMLLAAEETWNNSNAKFAEATLWHHTFKKYAAAQLNKRYEKATSLKMDSASWAGWASVKLFSDLLARNVSSTEITSLWHLKNSLAFDGQKGKDLFFNNMNYLEQPILLIQDEKIVAEMNANDLLESKFESYNCRQKE